MTDDQVNDLHILDIFEEQIADQKKIIDELEKINDQVDVLSQPDPVYDDQKIDELRMHYGAIQDPNIELDNYEDIVIHYADIVANNTTMIADKSIETIDLINANQEILMSQLSHVQSVLNVYQYIGLVGLPMVVVFFVLWHLISPFADFKNF